MSELTRREAIVLHHLAAGMTGRQIAARLRNSPSTIKDHSASIYRKLGVSGQEQRVRAAIMFYYNVGPGYTVTIETDPARMRRAWRVELGELRRA